MAVLFSPYQWPVTGANLNCSSPTFAALLLGNTLISLSDAPIIMAGVTILALISYVVMPESAWLPNERITHFIDSKGAVETVEEVENSNETEPTNTR